jgi:seryl-tRNA synthetase
MEISLLIQSVMGLIVLLGILLFLLMYSPSAKEKKIKKDIAKKKTKRQKTDLDSLRKIIKTKKTTTKELKDTLDLLLKHYGNIPKKVRGTNSDDFDIYMDIIVTICRHPNTTKDIILGFDKSLTRLNPEYKVEIGKAVARGIESR